MFSGFLILIQSASTQAVLPDSSLSITHTHTLAHSASRAHLESIYFSPSLWSRPPHLSWWTASTLPLQFLLHSAARGIFVQCKSSHIPSHLRSCLPWPRNHIQMPILAHQALCDLIPAYLSTLSPPSRLWAHSPPGPIQASSRPLFLTLPGLDQTPSLQRSLT